MLKEFCLSFDSKSDSDTSVFSDELIKLLSEYKSEGNVVFLCIGSDRATGDSLGPLIGYNLEKKGYLRVYGTLENPVHAKNLTDTVELINKEVENPVIVAIDASLGKSSSIGYYTLRKGPLKPGQGVGKDLPWVGHISITGVVNVLGLFDEMLLQTTRLCGVMKIVDRVCNGIDTCMAQLAS